MTAITFQTRVQPWLLACFGAEIAADRSERNHRFLEESLELIQSCGCTASEAHQLVDYVFGRPVGEPAQEAGGVMVTLAALCLANSLDMHEAGETELLRRVKWAARQLRAVAQAPAAPSALATQVIENLLQLARIVNTAVEDWGETKEDDSLEVIFHKDVADKMEAILEFFDSLPDAPAEEGVIESGPLRAARVLRAMEAPAAPAVDAQKERDAAFEAVRQRLCRIPRWSFHIDSRGNIRRVDDARGNWIEFSAAHELFDPVVVDAAIAAQAAAKGAA